MQTQRCKGILLKNSEVVHFSNDRSDKCYLPVRCGGAVAETGILCTECIEKLDRTESAEKTHKTIKGYLPQFLNGVVGEPLPFWSRLIGSTWYQEKLKKGYTISTEDMARAKKAVADAFGGAEQPPPQDYKTASEGATEKVKRQRKPKAEPVSAPVPAAKPESVAAAKPEPVPAAKPEPVAAAKPEPVPATHAAPRTRKSKAVPTSVVETPVAVVEAAVEPPEEISTVIHIHVKKTEIKGRSVYLEPNKDKVYDMKFRYIGRFDKKANEIVSFPDSDEER